MGSVQESMSAAVATAGVEQRRDEPAPRRFLEALADALRKRRVRYCVLHDWEGLPERLGSDLDMAVHPEDLAALGGAIQELRNLGYRLVQCLPYAPDAHYLVFFRISDGRIEAARVDVITAHWRRGIRVDSGEAMVARTRLHEGFQVPAAAVEFRYLAAKRVLKGGAPGGKGKRVARLLQELGAVEAEAAVADLFGADAPRVVEAAAGKLDQRARALQPGLLWRNAWRHPLHLVSFWWRDGVRRLRRGLRPTGLMVAVVGPDGVGKSTFIGNVVRGVAPAFRRVYRYHWRPGLLGSIRAGAKTVDPHGAGADPKWLSVLRLLWVGLDYQVARLRLRWQRARSGLVVFDRYYHDILVDPRRYRYGGPPWLARALARLAPKPDALLILHAPPEAVRARKQEVGSEELRRQLKGYLDLAEAAGGCVIDASAKPEVVAMAGISRVIDELERRTNRRCPEWAGTRGGRDHG